MVGLEEVLKGAGWQKSIQKSIGLTSQISEMMKAQEMIRKNFSGLGMISEITKIMQHQKVLAGPLLEAGRNSLAFQARLSIPNTALEAITSINRQHEQLFGSMRTMTEAIKFQSPMLAHVKNLQSALTGISGQIALIAAQSRNWTIVTDFEQVTEQTIEFSETLTEEITPEQQKQFQIILASVISFYQKNKKVGIWTFRVIEVFLLFAALHQYFDFLKDKPQIATKVEVDKISMTQDSIFQFMRLINEQLKKEDEYRITNRDCGVKLKPRSKTLTIAKLPKDFEVVVIQITHKWVYVSYFDADDNLPRTGWVLKKYLDKPELKAKNVGRTIGNVGK